MPKNHYENYCIDDISPNCINVIGEEYNHPNFSSLTYEIIKNVGDHIDRFKRYPTFEDFCRWKRYKHLYDIEADEIYTMFPNVIRDNTYVLKQRCIAIKNGLIDWKIYEKISSNKEEQIQKEKWTCRLYNSIANYLKV